MQTTTTKGTKHKMEAANTYSIIKQIRQGMTYSKFVSVTSQSPFSLYEWSTFLHLSERTMQRYKRERKAFDPIYTEKIMQIVMLYQAGIEVFGDSEKFDTWLLAVNTALGGIKPKDLLDNSFGIELLKDELIRIQHGVLA